MVLSSNVEAVINRYYCSHEHFIPSRLLDYSPTIILWNNDLSLEISNLLPGILPHKTKYLNGVGQEARGPVGPAQRGEGTTGVVGGRRDEHAGVGESRAVLSHPCCHIKRHQRLKVDARVLIFMRKSPHEDIEVCLKDNHQTLYFRPAHQVREQVTPIKASIICD